MANRVILRGFGLSGKKTKSSFSGFPGFLAALMRLFMSHLVIRDSFQDYMSRQIFFQNLMSLLTMERNYHASVLVALWANILSWLVATFYPSALSILLSKCEYEVDDDDCEKTSSDQNNGNATTRCILIGRPGGVEQLRVKTLKPGLVTCGYNVKDSRMTTSSTCLASTRSIQEHSESSAAEITKDDNPLIVVRTEAFSINYADCCIRWGLYESALQYVGWPIVPGFDVAGTVEQVIQQPGSAPGPTVLSVGDPVFGCTLFGAYSNQLLVPYRQLRPIPAACTMAQAASLPTVSLTALYALYLAGHFPPRSNYQYDKKSILIHSAAGGVGGMLVQMSRILGLHPIVGVVGNSSKVDEAKKLGCHVVIDKSTQPLWEVARQAAPQGYSTIMDANGVSTLRQSYQHLTTTGRLIVFGFHSNLPMGKSILSPLEWIRMAFKMMRMIRFDSMDLVISNKAVLGFNLSFLFDEIDLVSQLFDQICIWLDEKKLECPRVVELDGMDQITIAHDMIQSGKSIGKIVIKTNPTSKE